MMRLAKPIAALLLLASLGACQTTRYVTAHCLTPEQAADLEKAEPEKIGHKLTRRAPEDTRILAASNIELRAWGRGLMGVLQGCTGN